MGLMGPIGIFHSRYGQNTPAYNVLQNAERVFNIHQASRINKHLCLNPAAFGCRTCRLHGARMRSSIKAEKLPELPTSHRNAPSQTTAQLKTR